jgi:hypothetical protein
MACGRRKNLEIARGNLLCGPHDRRRNFLTTGNGSRRRGNPEPLGQGETPGHRRRESSESPVKGQPRAVASSRLGATRQRAFRATGTGGPEPPRQGAIPSQGKGETPSHGEGDTLSHPATGATPEPPARDDLGLRHEDNPSHRQGMTSGFGARTTRATRQRVEPRVTGQGRHPEPRGEEGLRAVGKGSPPSLRRRDNSGPPGEEVLSCCLGGDPGRWRRNSDPPRLGESLSHRGFGRPEHRPGCWAR